MGILNQIFGGSNTISPTELKEMHEKGATVVDVRTTNEFRSGHVNGAKNIPLQEIKDRLDEVKKIKEPLILCCASGNRSGQAQSFLSSQGIECVNGGGWMQVQNALN